jgi:hypothetical protein
MAGHPPKSYDEIIRRTVPDPEGSWRPSDDQVKRAYEGFRALDADEQDLHDRVRDALISAGIDTSRIAIEVTRDRVTLRGTVCFGHTLVEIENAVTRVDGVGELVDWLVIDSCD